MNGFRMALPLGRSFMLLAVLSLMAWAQVPQAFVSARTGVDGGACGVFAPCRTITHALTQVASGGQIVLTDSGDYDQVAINKSAAIMAVPGVTPSISVAQTNGVLLSVAAHSGIINITLSGLALNGQGVTQDGIRGADVNLIVENCTFDNFAGQAIFINGAATLQLVNSRVRHSAKGIFILPVGASKTVTVTVNECQFEHLTARGLEFNTNGINTIRAVVRDSALNGNVGGEGMLVSSISGGTAQVTLDGVQVTKFLTGLSVVSSGSVIRVTRSAITRNTTGLAAAASGALLSRGNNTVEGNITNGNFTGTFIAK